MNKNILSREVTVENNEVIIIKNVEEKYNRQQLEMKLRELQMRKISLKEQNKNIVSEYNKVLDEEQEIQALIEQLNVAEPPMQEI